MHILAEIALLDPASGTRTIVRAASAQDRTITALNGQRWWPGITQKPSLGLRLFDGDFSEPIDPGNATFTVAMDALERGWPSVRSWLWAGASVTLYAGASGQAWPWDAVFAGAVDEFKADGNKVSVTASVDTSPFEVNVLNVTYAGTGAAEGGSDLTGQPKPMLHGRCLNVEPVLIDTVNSVYQFHGYGVIDAVEALFERGSDFGAALGDYASYALLVAATIPSGRWATCLAQGLVRLGAPAAGVITGDVRGDAVGGYRNLTGAIIRRAAAIAGVAGAKIDAAAFAALDTAVPYPIGIFVTDQVNVIDLARRLALPCNAQAGVSWLGKLFTTRISLNGPTLTLDAQGKQLPPVVDASEVDVRPPYKRILFGAARSWRVHTADEIATSSKLNPRGRFNITDTYREDDWVDLPDGSTWIYVNSLASSGHAPPSPGTSNAWWDQRTPPTSATDIGYGDGTLADALGQKTKTWTQETPPSFEEAGPNDEWVNTADNRRRYRIVQSRLSIGGNEVMIGGDYVAYREWELNDDERVGDALTNAMARIRLFKQEADPNLYDAAGAALVPSPRQPPLINGDLWAQESSGTLRTWQNGAWDIGADITAANQVVVALAGRTIAANYLGVPAPEQFDLVMVPTVTKGGTDVRTAGGTSFALANVAAGLAAGLSVNDAAGDTAKGTVTLTNAYTAPGSFDLLVTVDGAVQPAVRVSVSQANGQPPSGGGGAGGGGGTKSGSTGLTGISLTSTSLVEIGRVAGLTLATGETIQVNAYALYYYRRFGSGILTAHLSAKAQYSPAGANSWTDMPAGLVDGDSAAASSGHTDDTYVDPEYAALSLTDAATGLAAGTFDVRMVAKSSAASGALNLTGGTFLVEVS